MRAPVQKTRPRRTGRQSAPEGGVQPPVGKGRPTHVRNRLIVAVAVVAAAIAGAGAPSVIAASGQLKDTQDLVTLAGQTQEALTLAHALADERDDVTSYIAAGRPKAKAPDEQRSARVDRQVEELRADTDLPAALRRDLDGIAAVRRAALTGKSGALEAHQAYSAAITELHRLTEQLAQQTPPRAGAGAYALAELDSAVQQAAATRGLLLAALNVPGGTQSTIDPVTGLPETGSDSSSGAAKQRDALTAAAQQARLRSDAALADFHQSAPSQAVASYDSTVTGPETTTAEKYLAGLTDQPTLDDDELDTSTRKLDAALSARIELMRGAESALFEHRTKDLEKLRDDDVTALEIRIAVLGALVLLAIGTATAMARSLTRPLAVLRRGSARLAEAEDPAGQEPVKFTGRNDEFAQVVRSVNALHAHAAALAERVATLESDRKHLVGQRQKMADAREELRAELAESAAQLDRLRTSIGSTFVNLALRTLGLVERQLAVIEGLEEREQDPDRLATLFKLDHFATVMRRHSENLLVLAGTEHVQQHAGPVPLVDVVRAAVSEIERYERVRIAALPPHAHVAGFAADDLSHLLAELMENATAFSPPDLPVEVSGWLLESGEVMLSVQDEGIGMTDERMQRLNARLTDFDPETPYDQEGEDGLGLGLYVVARLAHRHGVRVRLREQKQGGTAAVVVVPQPLLAAAPAAAVAPPAPSASTTQTFTLPGADAEANSNVLHSRASEGDRLIALAERAVRDQEHAERPTETAAQDGPTEPEEAGAGSTEPAGEAGTWSAEAETRSGQQAERPEQPEQAERAEEPGEAVPRPAAPVESPSEMTMELLIPSPKTEEAPQAAPSPAPEAAAADGGYAPQGPSAAPDHETRTGGAAGNAGNETAEGEAEAEAEAEHHRTADEEDQYTAKGLPKRTPKITAPTPAERPRTKSVDAEALRRRLGGFRQGATAGYRAAEAEIAEQTGQTRTTGGTVEEASS
ncbi:MULTISPECIES: nitrate- and nitrite sensing domain-containing protein [unclassified Streptomyces]|uniref:sensor histidine kinase n=1 Tax=unclassified Streptomyces TaxID=2593676 RepID=UPI0036F68B7C